MPLYPRPTQFITNVVEEIVQRTKSMMQNAEIREAYEQAFIILCEYFSQAEGLSFPLTVQESQALLDRSQHAKNAYQACIQTLVTLIHSHAPEVAQQWDDNAGGLEWLIFTAQCHRAGITLPQAPVLRISRLAPDNPIERRGEDLYYIPSDTARYKNKKHRRQCLLQIDGYITALTEPEKRGRRTKSSVPPTDKSSRATENHRNAEADIAYAMKQDGASWEEIATALKIDVPRPDRHTKKRRKAIAQMVSRRVERGRPEPENIPFSIRTRKKLPRGY